MEYLTINPGDFRVTMREKNKLYNIYGKEYELLDYKVLLQLKK